jgi:hypothetical protein
VLIYSACLRSHWRKPARRHREDDPPGKIFGALIEEVRFAEDSPLEQAGFEPPVPSDTTRDDRLRSLGGEVLGDERCVRRRIRDIRRGRASFFLDLGEQPGLNRGGRALLLRMIVGETAGLEDYGAQFGDRRRNTCH